MRFFWGFALVLIGLSGLGASLGYWDGSVMSEILRFWPLLLIFWGLESIFKKTKIYYAVMAVAVVLSGLLIYDAVFSPSPMIFGGSFKKQNQNVKKTEIEADLADNAEEAFYEFNVGALDFEITGASNRLIEGYVESNFLETKVNIERTEGIDKVFVSTPGQTTYCLFCGMDRPKSELRASLNKNLPLNLIIKSGAASHRLDLSEYILRDLRINTGASSVDLRIGGRVEENAKLSFEAGAASMGVHYPKEIGVKVIAETGLTSQSFPGYTKTSEKEFFSPDYEKSDKKIEIHFKSGVSSINLRPY